MTHLFLWESTDELHRTLLLPGCHGVVHGCESGVIDLDFIRSVLGFGFLCNKQATFREDAFPKKIKAFIYRISFKKPVTFASATKHPCTHIKFIQHIGQIIFTSLHVGQEITWSKNFGYRHARYSGHYIHVLFLPFAWKHSDCQISATFSQSDLKQSTQTFKYWFKPDSHSAPQI